MEETNKPKVTIHRVGVGGYLHRLVPIIDSSGKVIKSVLKPLMVELRARDVIQILVGSSILAIPIAFTEETWNLGEQLPWQNILILSIISILFIALFVYYNFYRHYLRKYIFQYIKRVVLIYFLSLLVVGILMTVINQCPWSTDWILAVKRIIIVAFPASLSATITDSIK
jgi:uncharacterized membrane protein